MQHADEIVFPTKEILRKYRMLITDFRLWFTICLPFIGFPLSAQDKPAYKLFTGEGKEAPFTKMISEFQKADIILFGELHNNTLNHWLELQIVKEIYARRSDLILGMEMFEADDQIVLSEYLEETIDEPHLLNETKVWDNYKTDYKPLIEFAKEKKIPVIATNIPRRYANLVFKKGIESLNTLPGEARRWIAPLPVEIDLTLPGYKEMTGMSGHGTNINSDNMAKSQAVKDATMAHFILKNRKGIFVHIHGAYHSKNFEGIYWYLRKADPKLKIVTVHSVEQNDIQQMEEAHKNTADYIVCLPKDMIKSY